MCRWGAEMRGAPHRGTTTRMSVMATIRIAAHRRVLRKTVPDVAGPIRIAAVQRRTGGGGAHGTRPGDVGHRPRVVRGEGEGPGWPP